MNSSILNYENPANEWVEGLPLGNGTIGAMLFGEVGKEQLTLNHDRLFRKNIVKDIETSHLIPKMRELILAGKTKEADDYFLDNVQKTDESQSGYQMFGDSNIIKIKKDEIVNAYQVFGELKFGIEGVHSFVNYARSIDLSEGIARLGFTSDNKEYHYETFVSKIDNALILKLYGDEISCSLELTRTKDDECGFTIDYKNGQIIFDAKFVEGVSFASVANLKTDSGDVCWRDKKLLIKDAGEIVIKQVFCTSYTAQDPLADCLDQMTIICKKSYDDLKAAHISENKRLFDRVSFKLGSADTQKTTEQCYKDIYDNKYIDNSMYMQLFNMGRYYMMCCSRPGSYPMNLQGIWNDSIAPYWESGYTMDMNIQMQYWAAQPCNLSECELPVFQWLSDYSKTLEEYAKNILGTRGYLIPQYSDIHFTHAAMHQYKCSMFQILWIGVAAWLGQHFYEYWKFTRDDDFLVRSAYPYLKQCAYLFKDYLVKDENGKYICVPSYSPENRTMLGSWSVNTSTIDITLIHEVLTHLMEIDDYLKLDSPDRIWWEDINNDMVGYPFDKDGNLLEWIDSYDVEDPYHRHISHIYGIFPGKLFTPEKDKKIYDAAVKAIYKRREGGFSQYATWSHAWFACCFSRICSGDEALGSIDNLMKSGMCGNFITLCNDWRDQGYTYPFVDYKLICIEALMGATAAIAEMFVQSFDDGIKIMPALPAKWPEGKISGLRTYGGFEIAIEWEDSKIKNISVVSHIGGNCILKICKSFYKDMALKDQKGNVLFKINENKNEIVFKTQKNCSYFIANE